MHVTRFVCTVLNTQVCMLCTVMHSTNVKTQASYLLCVYVCIVYTCTIYIYIYIYIYMYVCMYVCIYI